MKCTIENLNKVFDLVSEKHVDSGGSGADFALWDDESDLLVAVSETIEWVEEATETEKKQKDLNGIIFDLIVKTIAIADDFPDRHRERLLTTLQKVKVNEIIENITGIVCYIINTMKIPDEHFDIISEYKDRFLENLAKLKEKK